MHVHLEGVGLKARPLTLKLTTDSGYQSHSYLLQCSAKGKRLKENYVSASGLIWDISAHAISAYLNDTSRKNWQLNKIEG